LWTIPRELPFDHDGFGQDDEWVAANFTNATSLAVGDGGWGWANLGHFHALDGQK